MSYRDTDTYTAELVTESDEFGYQEWSIEFEATIASDGCVDFGALDMATAKPVYKNPFFGFIRKRVLDGQGHVTDLERACYERQCDELHEAFNERSDEFAANILAGALARKAYSEAEARADFPALFDKAS